MELGEWIFFETNKQHRYEKRLFEIEDEKMQKCGVC